jgi:hypothetical protein
MSFGGRAQILDMVESIWCAGADHRSRHQCVAEQPSCAPTFTTMYCYTLLLFGGTCADVGHCRSASARAARPTIDLAARARLHRRRARQRCLRCTSTRRCRVVVRAQMSHNVDSSRRAVHRPSTSLPVHGGAAAVCAKVAYDVPVPAVVIRRDERRCWTMSTRFGARCSVDQRSRHQCAQVPWND